MIYNRHIDRYIDKYIDNELTRSHRVRIDSHLKTCDRCKALVAGAQKNLNAIRSLPNTITPPVDLWPAIQGRLAVQAHGRGISKAGFIDSFKFQVGGHRIAASVAVIAAAVTLYLVFSPHPGPMWHVTALEGNPRVGNSRVGAKTELQIGDWIETDAQSRARIGIDSIGQIDVGSGTAIQFVEATGSRRRFALKVGEIHAKVDAPPRLFVVTTPSVQAVDLGCDYALQVDSTGAGTLRVYYGWVSLEYAGLKSIVPAGALCLTRPGAGPGTPYADSASDSLREELIRYDFEGGGKNALEAILRLARTPDALTLWHLLFKADRDLRSTVYDCLTQLIAPPHRVTRAGFLAGDSSMVRAWQERLDIYSVETWQFH